MSSGLTAWLWLSVAIACEILGTAMLKGASTAPGVLNISGVVVGYAASFVTFALALRAGMDMGVGYAVWSAIGTAVIVAIGVLFYRESITPTAVFFLALIIVGVVGLNLSHGGHSA